MYTEQGENFRVYKDFLISRTNPYGFWVIKGTDNKGIPGLEEAFTQVSLAVKAVDAYLSKVPSKRKGK